MVIIVLLCVRHSFGHLTLLSRLLFHRVSTLSHGKCTFIFGSLNFPTFLQVYFMYHETLGRKLKKYLAKATRSLLGRLVNLPVKKLKKKFSAVLTTTFWLRQGDESLDEKESKDQVAQTTQVWLIKAT